MKVLSFALIIAVMHAFGAPPITETASAGTSSCSQHSIHYREDHTHEYCRTENASAGTSSSSSSSSCSIAGTSNCSQHSIHYKEVHIQEYCQVGAHWIGHTFCYSTVIQASICNVSYPGISVYWCGCVFG